MFCLGSPCAPSSPVFTFHADMSLLLIVKCCLVLVSSLTPCHLSFGPTHVFFRVIPVFSNCTEVKDSNTHICICTAFLLGPTMQICTSSAFSVPSLACEKLAVVYTEFMWSKFVFDRVCTHSIIWSPNYQSTRSSSVL